MKEVKELVLIRRWHGLCSWPMLPYSDVCSWPVLPYKYSDCVVGPCYPTVMCVVGPCYPTGYSDLCAGRS